MGRFLILVTLVFFIVAASANQGYERSDVEELKVDGKHALESERLKRAAARDEQPSQKQSRKGRKKRKHKTDRKLKPNPKKTKKPRRNRTKAAAGKGKKEKENKAMKKGGRNRNKKRKKNKLKNKKKNDKRKKNKRNKTERGTRQDNCNSNQANSTCMQAAMIGMAFERDQITNYLKQSKLHDRHHSLSGNKANKHDEFKEAEEHLLWAIGGNWSDPKCGPNDTTTSKYNATLLKYELELAKTAHAVLENCSIAVRAACNTSNLENHNKTEIDNKTALCQDMMKDAIGNNARCQKLTTNITAACECWTNQTIVIGRIKEFKCQKKEDQKLVTKFKNNCINTFSKCKQMVDKSVESVYYCMDDHSMKFINQTTDSLSNSISKDANSKRLEDFEFIDRLEDLDLTALEKF